MHDLSKLICIHAANDLYQKFYLISFGCSWSKFQKKVQPLILQKMYMEEFTFFFSSSLSVLHVHNDV